MANIRERTGRNGKRSFAVQVRKSGFPARTASFPTRRMAERWATTVEAEMIEGRHFKNVSSRRRTVADAIDKFILEVLPTPKYRSGKTGVHAHRLGFWREEIGGVLLNDVTPEILDEKLQKLLTTSYTRSKRPGAKRYRRTPSTTNKYAAHLSRVFKTCRKSWRWMTGNPFSDIEKLAVAKSTVRKVLNDGERTRLFVELAADPDPQLEVIAGVAIAAAPRAGELTNLTWDDIDLDALLAGAQEARVMLRKTKNDEPRVVWLTGRALRLVVDHWERMGRPLGGRVFRGKGRVYTRKGLSRAGGVYGYHKPFKAACARAGIPHFKFHWLRHCAATWLAQSGATDRQLKAVGGWKSDVVKVYTHMTGDDALDAIRRMNDKKFG